MIHSCGYNIPFKTNLSLKVHCAAFLIIAKKTKDPDELLNSSQGEVIFFRDISTINNKMNVFIPIFLLCVSTCTL